MTQKVFKVGSSAAVPIPKKSLAELGLKIGDRVEIRVDRARRAVSIRPNVGVSGQDARIARLTLDFINRYRKDLEALAR